MTSRGTYHHANERRLRSAVDTNAQKVCRKAAIARRKAVVRLGAMSKPKVVMTIGERSGSTANPKGKRDLRILAQRVWRSRVRATEHSVLRFSTKSKESRARRPALRTNCPRT